MGKISTQICRALCSSYMITGFHTSVAESQVRVPLADVQNLEDYIFNSNESKIISKS